MSILVGPLCRDLVNFLNEDVQTQILWKNLRPVVLGKITYAPDIPSVRKIIEKVEALEIQLQLNTNNDDNFSIMIHIFPFLLGKSDLL